ncbi:response regulator [Roseitranquillus sediminis]|uniref:hypothetical protein n=1 Tax=Roseitranquillus sediminis TaxID=2809051 RepID=UPI001D0C01B9|nr:hypothetical protein [Roseitranquillus sediminis]MBM9595715.1 hypothetical protein [Roseitranquillus sediminis]
MRAEAHWQQEAVANASPWPDPPLEAALLVGEVHVVERKTKVLIVEDEIIVGLDLADVLKDEGFETYGPYRSTGGAIEAFEEVAPEIGVFDINLGADGTSHEIAERFQRDGKPFVFLTGYGAAGNEVMSRFPNARSLTKPVDPRAVASLLRSVLG